MRSVGGPTTRIPTYLLIDGGALRSLHYQAQVCTFLGSWVLCDSAQLNWMGLSCSNAQQLQNFELCLLKKLREHIACPSTRPLNQLIGKVAGSWRRFWAYAIIVKSQKTTLTTKYKNQWSATHTTITNLPFPLQCCLKPVIPAEMSQE